MSAELLPPDAKVASRPLWLVPDSAVDPWLASLEPAVAAWLREHDFRGERGRVVSIPGADRRVAGCAAGMGNIPNLENVTVWHGALLPERLPPGTYHLAHGVSAAAATQLALGFRLGAYRFSRYRPALTPSQVVLRAPPSTDMAYVNAAAEALAHARDLINTPANDLGPAELADSALALAASFGAQVSVIEGEALLAQGFPLIHAVGRGSSRAPRLIDLRWGSPSAPRVTIVGKGVCFDTGGLDIKPSAGMLLMKKDMGGAACALALARMLMALQAPIRLRVLVPAVENAVDGNAFRPSDVLTSRKGLTVEIGNTDAEGRLVLADALAEADAERPDLLIDLATLTGAARMALGPELPAVFSNDETLLADLRACGERETDPVWPMPLWAGYDEDLASRVADLNNVSPTPFAGAIIGALFLRRFVTQSPRWVHVDLYGWNPKERPGRPVGAEPQSVRALYRFIRARYG